MKCYSPNECDRMPARIPDTIPEMIAWAALPPQCRWILQRHFASTCHVEADAVPVDQLLSLAAADLMAVKGVGRARADNTIQTLRAMLLPHGETQTTIATADSSTAAITIAVDPSSDIPMDLIDPRYRWIVARFATPSDTHVPDAVPRSLLASLTLEDLLRVQNVGPIRAERAIAHLRAIAFTPLLRENEDRVPPILTRLPDLDSLHPVVRDAAAHIRIPLVSLPTPLATALSGIVVEDTPEDVSVGAILALHEEHFAASNVFSDYEARCLIALRNDTFCSPTLVILAIDGAPRDDISVAALLCTALETRWSVADWEARAGLTIPRLLRSLDALVARLPTTLAERARIYHLDLRYASRILEGETLEQVGAIFGVTRERVRQRIARVGLSGRIVRAMEQSQRDDITRRYRPRVEEYIRTHPGCSLDDIVATTGCPRDRIEEFASALEWLVLDASDAEESLDEPLPSHSDTRHRGVVALRLAATLCFPLSYKSYDELLRDRYVTGPSAVRIIQVFGTWRTACDAAGIESGRAGTAPGHAAIWTHDDVLDSVCDFLACLQYQGQSSRYEEWRVSDKGCHQIPSFGTVRNVLGHSWPAVRRRALFCMRQRWVDGGLNEF